MLSRLRHPNIVQFLGVHFNEGSPLPVLLMERLHSTLAACVDRHGKLPEECCYAVLRDVGVGLRYLHGLTPNPIVHRDLTANNVLVTPDMSAKISDLGVAKILNLSPARMTQLTKCPGTLSYMPPEALVERPIYSTKIDVFSYGNLMTHVFCGRWPIPAEIFRANPSNPHDLTPLTEVQRRETYLNDIGDAHPLMSLMRECLSNNPSLRPGIPEALHRVKEVMPQFPPAFENKAEVLHRIQGDATVRASLNAQVSSLSAQVEQKEEQLLTISNENANLDDQLKDLLPLRNEMQQLQAHISKMEEQRVKQLQSNLEESERKQAEITRKGTDYDILMQRFTKLQQIHAALEKEREAILRENATLEDQLSGYMYTGDVNDQSSQLQQDREELAMQYEAQLLELREQLETVMKEKDSLLANRERVSAQWEGRVRRLEQQLKAYQEGKTSAEVDSVTVGSSQSAFAELESQVSALKSEVAKKEQTERQLMEMKDRNAALEEQLSEYAGAVRDQSKVIQGTMATTKAQDAEMLRAQQQHIHLTEYMKKQQLEYTEALSSIKKKIASVEKVTGENVRLHQLNVSLTGELEDYRTQTKLLLEDLKQKEEEIIRLKEEVPVRSLLERSELDQRDRLELELEIMKRKCDAWRQEGEKLLPLRNELQQLQAHISEMEEQCEHLRSDNDGLAKQLRSILDESERKQAELTRKGTDYDILMQRFTELQQIRATLENELSNCERVTAQGQVRIRRLEQQLKTYQEAFKVDSVSGGSSQSAFAELESQVSALKSEVAKKEKTERQLMEMKDRNAALEEQLSEYAGAVRDQSKVIQGTMATTKAQDAEMLRAQQQHIHLTEYMKKQQLEYTEALSSIKKKIASVEKVTGENVRLHQLNVSLTGELEDYRTQTKLLLEDLKQKEEEIVRLKEEAPTRIPLKSS